MGAFAAKTLGPKGQIAGKRQSARTPLRSRPAVSLRDDADAHGVSSKR
jgi:hypothetical protein